MTHLGHVRVDDALLERSRSAAGGLSREQLRILGVVWPPVGDWLRRVKGTWLTEDRAELLVDVRGDDHPLDTAWRTRVRRSEVGSPGHAAPAHPR